MALILFSICSFIGRPCRKRTNQMTPNLTSTDIDKACSAAIPDAYPASGNGKGGPPPYRDDPAYQPLPDDPVYLLLYPAAAAVTQMATLGSRLGRQLHLPGRPAEAKRLHLTLHFLCHFARLTSGLLAKVDNTLSGLTMPPFLIGFDRVMNFGRERGKLVLCGNHDSIAGVMMLWDEIVLTLSPIGLCQGRHSYTPHVTLNYADCFVRERQIAEICWPVREVALVCSLQGQSRHRVIRRWRLRAPGWLN
jgi:2'-5' RNA ligase